MKQDAGKVMVRALRYDDVDRIHEIDRILTMNASPRRGVDLWSLVGESTTSFGADVDGKLAGFVLADVRPWEFGAREAVGWVIALGVHPDYQTKGIGKMLGTRVMDEFRRLGVRHASTLVGKDDARLREYFESIGFAESDQRVLGARL